MHADEQVSAKGTVRKYFYISIGFLVVAGIAAVWNHRGQKDDGASANSKPLVTVLVPTRGDVASSVSVNGQVAAVNDMPIGVDGNAGRISQVLVEPGDYVRRGQVLARMNPIAAQSQVDSAQAGLEELRSSAAVAQAEWTRAQRARDAFSVEEAERRRVAATNAEARVKAAEAQLASARDLFERTTVIAPTDGIVLTRTAEVGQIAVPGGPALFRLARGGAVEVRAQVAEQDMPQLKLGQPVRVRLDGVAQEWAGKVWQIGAIIDPQTRQGSVRIALPSGDRNLRPGAFVRADVATGKAPGMILPQTAVLSDERGTYVLVVGDGDKVERRAVQLAGLHQQGVLVSGGLSGNERVVSIAGAFLRIGEQVAIARTGEADAAASTGSKPPVAVSQSSHL